MWMFYEYLRKNVEGGATLKKIPAYNEKVAKLKYYNKNMT